MNYSLNRRMREDETFSFSTFYWRSILLHEGLRHGMGSAHFKKGHKVKLCQFKKDYKRGSAHLNKVTRKNEKISSL